MGCWKDGMLGGDCAKKASAGGMDGSEPASIDGERGERPNCEAGGEAMCCGAGTNWGTKTGAMADPTAPPFGIGAGDVGVSIAWVVADGMSDDEGSPLLCS